MIENMPNVISLFSGAGGSSRGCHDAGCPVILGVENNPSAARHHRINCPDVQLIERDIRKVPVEECLERTNLRPRELPLLVATPPCQGFSTQGKRDYSDPRNYLYREVLRFLIGLLPRVVIFENVKGLILGRMRLIFADLYQQIKNAGYHVSARLLDAKYFEVPQQRERLIIIAVRNDLGMLPSHPHAFASPRGCRRLDSIPMERPSWRTAKIVKEGQVATTITTRDRFWWNNQEAWGIRSYADASAFPEDFVFDCSHDMAIRLIGNAIPPKFMYHVVRHVKVNILERTTVSDLNTES